MRKIFLTAIIFLLSFQTCAAVSDEEFDAAEMRFMCAICSFGAYSDDKSVWLRSALTSRGCQVEKLSQSTNRADAKVFLISKDNKKILTIAGTESFKDIEVDFRTDRVPLNSDTPIQTTGKKAGDEIFVHRGFRDYADVILKDGLIERLKNSLEQNPDETLYLTGHSLGGSVATIMGIRLIEAGVDKNRFKVITFAAPAIGSRALADEYKDKLDLTRVVIKGDIIESTTRALGFKEFGNVIKWEPAGSTTQNEHKMAVYLDCAIRDYYSAGGDLREDMLEQVNASIYVAPILIAEKHFKSSDAKIIVNVLNDSILNHFGHAILAKPMSIDINEKKLFEADFDAEIDSAVAAAKESGCKFIVFRVLHAKKIRDSRSGERHVTLEETVFNADGFPLLMQTSGSSTANLTLIEAALSAQEVLNEAAKDTFK
ncbi:MAG: lipase family protein [Selenomonadaceae bacterium]|nr:lipase family protein [Selenomonadaceae bacterium]